MITVKVNDSARLRKYLLDSGKYGISLPSAPLLYHTSTYSQNPVWTETNMNISYDLKGNGSPYVIFGSYSDGEVTLMGASGDDIAKSKKQFVKDLKDQGFEYELVSSISSKK